MDFLIGMGFVLCMLYLFYERESSKKARPQVARASRTSASRGSSKGRRTTKRKSRYKSEVDMITA
jgi:hypothetical protein